MISLNLSTTPRRIGNLTGGRSAASAPWDFAPSAVLHKARPSGVAEPSLDGSIIIPFPGSWPPPDAVRHLYRHFSQSFSKFLLTFACRSKAPREHYVPVGMYMQFSKSVKGLITDSPYQPLHLFGIKRRLVNLFSGIFLKFRPQIYFLTASEFSSCLSFRNTHPAPQASERTLQGNTACHSRNFFGFCNLALRHFFEIIHINPSSLYL